MLDIAGGVLLALVAYRALAVVLTEVLRRSVDYQRKSSLARQLRLYGSGAWAGSDSRLWRVMQRLGIQEARRS